MKYLKQRRMSNRSKGFGDPAFRDDDPMTGVANLFDIGLVFYRGAADDAFQCLSASGPV